MSLPSANIQNPQNVLLPEYVQNLILLLYKCFFFNVGVGGVALETTFLYPSELGGTFK